MTKKPSLSAVKAAVKQDKFKRGSLAVVFTVIFIAVVVVVNVLVSVLTTRFPSLNFDMTKEGLNTLSEEAVDVAKGVAIDTTIYIIGSEDAIRGDKIYTNYGLKYSQVANLADRLREVNDKIKVQFIDPDLNPTFISEYPEDSLSSGKVLISTEKRKKVLSVTDLFSIQQDQNTGEQKSYSMVDGALANALYLVNLDKVPVVSVATGHEELLSGTNLAALTALLEDNNYEVKTFDILKEEIPADTSMIFVGTPTTDYSADEIAKIEAFLNDKSMESSRTLFFNAFPTQSWASMPNLKAFLAEWGLEPQNTTVCETDANNVLPTQNGDPSYVFATVNKDVFGDKTYENLIMPASASVKRLFNANNDIVTYSAVETQDTAYVQGTEEEMTENPETGVQTIVALAQRYMDNLGQIKSNVVVNGCSTGYLSSFLSNSTFGNKNMTVDLVKDLTDTTDTRVGLSVKQTETNTLDIAAPSGVIITLGLGVFTVALPLVVLIAGLVIFLRRRHL